MAGLGTILSIVPAALISAAGAVGTIAAGQAAKASANYEAKQLDQQAAEERAASQRDALEIRQQKLRILGRQQSIAAASGLGALDPTILDLAGDVEREGTYREQMALYGGEQRGRGREMQAAAARASGRAAAAGSLWSAAGTIVGGLSSWYDKYGGAGPPQGGTSTGYRYG